jgi:UDPglucose 6-dehydrogenase
MVGKATARSLKIDKYYDINGSGNITMAEAGKCDFIFICVPTPTVNGICDLSAIDNVLVELIPELSPNSIIVIRSTVIPGTTKKLIEETGVESIVANPEFLTEATWENDADNPVLVVIGSEDPKFADAVKDFYQIYNKRTEYVITNTTTAETIKYSLNVFFALKVVYANLLYNFCQSNKALYGEVKKVLESHPWGSKNHFEVFHKGGRGAGGKCLGKDLEAFASISQSSFLKMASDINKSLLTKYPKNA